MPRPQTPNHPPHPPKENLAWLTPSSYVPVYDKVTSLLLSNGGAQLLQTACIAGNVTPCRNDNMRMVISKRNNIHQDLLYCTCNLGCNQTHWNTVRLVFIRSKLSTSHLPHIYSCFDKGCPKKGDTLKCTLMLKCTLQSLSELRGTPDTKTSHSTSSFQASKHTYFWKYLYNLWGNFFASVWLHDNFILHQNRIFCINDAKTRPRLNTGTVW